MKARETRRNVLVPARMRADGAWVDVCIHNVSSRGLLLRGEEPPERGTYVEILGPAQTIIGRVAWRAGRRFGVRTQDRINLDALIGAGVPESASGEGSAAGTDAGRGNADGPRAPSPMAMIERSRRISGALQFTLLVAFGAAAAILAFRAVQQALARPLSIIARHLGQG